MIRNAKAFLDHPAVTRFIQIVAIISLGISLYTSQRVYQLASCVATYNDRVNRVNAIRAETYERATKSEDDMWLAFADAQKLPPDEAKRVSVDAFNLYVEERRQAQQDRANHPLPPPPAKVCR